MTQACSALGLSRATAYRCLRSRPLVIDDVAPRRAHSHRRIPDDERAAILALLDSERFIDQPPREVYATLLSEGTFACSWRTMYRLLSERGPVRERRDQRAARHNAVPRLIACAPNQVWSWDISKLATYERGVFLNLYVVLDLYSRYVVAWMVAAHENSALAKQLFRMYPRYPIFRVRRRDGMSEPWKAATRRLAKEARFGLGYSTAWSGCAASCGRSSSRRLLGHPAAIRSKSWMKYSKGFTPRRAQLSARVSSAA